MNHMSGEAFTKWGQRLKLHRCLSAPPISGSITHSLVKEANLHMCSVVTRILYFSTSAPRFEHHIQPTQHSSSVGLCFSLGSPRLSNYPQIGRASRECAFSSLVHGWPSHHKPRIRGQAEGQAVGNMDLKNVNIRRHICAVETKRKLKKRLVVNKWTNIQAVLHSVVTAASLFICVPPSEKEAAPIGSRCERKETKTRLKGDSLDPWSFYCCRATVQKFRRLLRWV